MHVFILNQTFHPDTAATAQLMWDLARHLDEAGVRVSVVTSDLFYGTDLRHERALEKYGRTIEVHRVGGTGFGKKSELGLVGRMSDFASFYITAARKMLALPTPDVVLALTSPPMISLLAVAYKWFAWHMRGRRVRVIYHVMDLYPDAAVAPGLIKQGSLLQRILGQLTSLTLRRSDAVIALGRDMKQRILDEYPRVQPERVHVVTPWAEGEKLWPIPKNENRLASELGLNDAFTVVYSGNLGVAHDVETIVNAIESTRNDAGIRWIFFASGKHAERVNAEAEKRHWPHFRALPLQNREDLNLSLNAADVHLVSQLPAFTGIVVPSKLFGILAVGKPSIMVGPAEAECSMIISENNAGFVIPNGDSGALVAAIHQLRADESLRREMGNRARAAFEREYDARVACARIEQLLRGQ